MDELLNLLRAAFKYTILLISKLYYKISFLFNKQRTIQNIYKPITKEKHDSVEALTEKLRQLGNKNTSTETHIEKLKKDNTQLKIKISAMQNVLLKRD